MLEVGYTLLDQLILHFNKTYSSLINLNVSFHGSIYKRLTKVKVCGRDSNFPFCWFWTIFSDTVTGFQVVCSIAWYLVDIHPQQSTCPMLVSHHSCSTAPFPWHNKNKQAAPGHTQKWGDIFAPGPFSATRQWCDVFEPRSFCRLCQVSYRHDIWTASYSLIYPSRGKTQKANPSVLNVHLRVVCLSVYIWFLVIPLLSFRLGTRGKKPRPIRVSSMHIAHLACNTSIVTKLPT